MNLIPNPKEEEIPTQCSVSVQQGGKSNPPKLYIFICLEISFERLPKCTSSEREKDSTFASTCGEKSLGQDWYCYICHTQLEQQGFQISYHGAEVCNNPTLSFSYNAMKART